MSQTQGLAGKGPRWKGGGGLCSADLTLQTMEQACLHFMDASLWL